MGFFQRLFTPIEKAPYEEQGTLETDDKVTVKDLLRFMEKQSEQNTILIKSVLETNVAQSETLKNYIELFKPRYVESTTLEQREAARNAKTNIRESEWEGIPDATMFNQILGSSTGVPPEPEEF
jgi:hypothetical protein